ncbi:tetratricopeptide repeat protein [Polyangium spumosum]|uniref:Tetratricopeptide repeat protein n=1 Tax=Polyangium spumosum TaxID=889282 RepID=A0A6N7PZP9_9BACT|nr:tetratricopeptide repeat protein [Polyangium spumosum]MRG97578.1 tetratricopeptide repeat protein [Polyangium spumosum]
MRIRWIFPFVPALLLTLPPARGEAEEQPPGTTTVQDNRALALEHAHKGLEAYRAGRFEEACDEFREAERLFPAPTLRVHIAHCQRKLGNLVAAKALYEEVLAEPLPKDAPPPFVQARKDAERGIAEVEAEIAARSRKETKVKVAPARPKGSIVPGVATLGLGVLGVGVGAVTGALSFSKVDDIRARCQGNHCLAADRDNAEQARLLGNVSTVAFVVGGAAAAAGVALLVLRPGGEADDLRVHVGLGRATFEFHY